MQDLSTTRKSTTNTTLTIIFSNVIKSKNFSILQLFLSIFTDQVAYLTKYHFWLIICSSSADLYTHETKTTFDLTISV